MGLPFRLLLITDGAPELLRRTEAALAVPGTNRVAVLLRDKQTSSRALLETARALRALTLQRAARLLVSDRLDVALLAEADGVHLPEAGFAVTEARRLLGPVRLIGVSRHSHEGILAAQEAGADYATLSPVFASPGKGTPLGMASFAQIVQSSSLPILALGGVGLASLPALIQAGAAGVAVVREVMSAAAPGAAVSQLLRALETFDPA